MRIGDCNFGGLYTIELSTAAPPDPFYTKDGGEEWEPDGENCPNPLHHILPLLPLHIALQILSRQYMAEA